MTKRQSSSFMTGQKPEGEGEMWLFHFYPQVKYDVIITKIEDVSYPGQN